MIQPTYISERKCGNKWYPMDDAPVPLLRTNYLSEFRTEIEKARVRKNLGIPDDMQMRWGGMKGHLEEQDDLVIYVRQKAEEYADLKAQYVNEISSDITTVSQALDYVIQFIIDQRQNNSDVELSLDNIEKSINEAKEFLDNKIDTNSDDIDALELVVEEINKSIEKINQDLVNLDIAPKIVAWIENHTSDTIKWENEQLQVIISNNENNAVVNQGGLFVKDNSQDILVNTQAIQTIQGIQTTIQEQIKGQQEAIEDIKDEIDEFQMGVAGYNTELEKTLTTPNTVGGIPAGTTVEALSKKTLVQIIDDLLFPTVVKDLVYPTLQYSSILQSLVKIGTTASKPLAVFNPGDSGGELSRVEKLLLNGLEIDLNTSVFDQLGTYTYQITVNYDKGAPAVDNKGQEVPDKFIPAGSLNRSTTHTTTYPWFVNGVEQSYLVRINSSSGVRSISMGGKASIELPGANSSISSLTVNGGMGFMPVDWDAWEVTTKTRQDYPGVVYKVWTLKSEYSDVLNHEINFTLAL